MQFIQKWLKIPFFGDIFFLSLTYLRLKMQPNQLSWHLKYILQHKIRLWNLIIIWWKKKLGKIICNWQNQILSKLKSFPWKLSHLLIPRMLRIAHNKMFLRKRLNFLQWAHRAKKRAKIWPSTFWECEHHSSAAVWPNLSNNRAIIAWHRAPSGLHLFFALTALVPGSSSSYGHIELTEGRATVRTRSPNGKNSLARLLAGSPSDHALLLMCYYYKLANRETRGDWRKVSRPSPASTIILSLKENHEILLCTLYNKELNAAVFTWYGQD